MIENDTTPDLPASSGSTDGVTASSLGDCSMADLKLGYCPCKDESYDSAYVSTDTYQPASALMQQGFLGRPQGWER